MADPAVWTRVLAFLLLLAPLATTAGRAQQGEAGRETRAQRLVEETLRRHPQLTGVELAVVSDQGCAVLAATDLALLGEKCGDDEERPMKTGEPNVEEPTVNEPVYDITQALHDSSGRLLGTFAMDIKPKPGQDRAAMVSLARTILREIEAQIPSKEKLFERVK
ncbi:MAG: PDC sensor domain-containing protein [Candidatus Methylomirabilaceae bacterium]